MANELTKEKKEKNLFPGRRGESLFRSFQREMNRLFDNFYLEPLGGSEGWHEQFIPIVDISEDDKEVRVSAELPGMDENDIEVNIRDSMLTIEGQKEQKEEQSKKGFYRRESSYGSFRRIIDLPSDVDEDKVQAEFMKGVLKIKLPKTEEAKNKAKKIEINSD